MAEDAVECGKHPHCGQWQHQSKSYSQGNGNDDARQQWQFL